MGGVMELLKQGADSSANVQLGAAISHFLQAHKPNGPRHPALMHTLPTDRAGNHGKDQGGACAEAA